MDLLKKCLRRFLLVLMILLACAGIGLPIPTFVPDKFRIKTEIIEKRKEDEDDVYICIISSFS